MQPSCWELSGAWPLCLYGPAQGVCAGGQPYRLPGGDLGGQLKAPSVLAPLPISFPPVIESVACDRFVQLSLSFSLWRQQWECEQGVTNPDGPNINSCRAGPGGGQGLLEDPKDTSSWCVQTTRWVVSSSAGALRSLLSTHPALRNQGAKGTRASWPGDPKDRTSSALLSSHRLDPRPTAGSLAMSVFHPGVSRTQMTCWNTHQCPDEPVSWKPDPEPLPLPCPPTDTAVQPGV